MANKIFEYDEEARQKNLQGVEKLARAVRSTLGPRGRNVMIERKHRPPIITKDGATVAKHVDLKDPMEQMAAELVKDVASKTSDDAGDGTTTATILTHAIYKEGCKRVADGASPMELKRGIDAGVKAATEVLLAMSTPCNTPSAIAQVGTISANSDKEIGNIIAKAMSAAGRDGVISVEEGTGFDHELELVDGMKLDVGYISPYFINKQGSAQCELEDAMVLIVNGELTQLRDVEPLLSELTKTRLPVLIISDDIKGDILPALVINAQQGNLRSCAVPIPGVGDNGRATLQDLAILTGATVVGAENNLKIEHTKLEHLGRAKKIIVTKDSTTLIDGAGDPKLIRQRVESLIQEAKEEKDPRRVEQIKHRAAKMSGGVAIIKVGAATETEMTEKKARVEDALHATQAAVEEGIVPGGGTAYIRVLDATREGAKKLINDSQDQKEGVEIVIKALQAPLKQLACNAGEFPDNILNDVVRGKGSFGYDARHNLYGDMMALGIVDPTKVARSALQNAASVAGLMLTTNCMIADEVKREDE